MRKFTVFSVILSVVVVVVVAEIVSSDYLSQFKKPQTDDANNQAGVFNLPDSIDLSKNMQTSVVGTNEPIDDTLDDANSDKNKLGFDLEDANIEASGDSAYLQQDYEEAGTATGDPQKNADSVMKKTTLTASGNEKDFEDDNFVPYSPNVYIREEQITSAGFENAYLEDDVHGGFLFKTIYIDDLNDVESKKYLVRTKTEFLAKIYIFRTGANTNIDEVYQVLKMRASEGLDVEVNETNDFGNGSFYINDLRRENTAFLVVKIENLIYSFSYPKNYHPQIKNLLALIGWELGKELKTE